MPPFENPICACAASQFGSEFVDLPDGDPVQPRPIHALTRLAVGITLGMLAANTTRIAAMDETSNPWDQSQNKRPPMGMVMCNMPGMAGGMMPAPNTPSAPLAPCCQGSRDEAMADEGRKRLKEQERRAGQQDEGNLIPEI